MEFCFDFVFFLNNIIIITVTTIMITGTIIIAITTIATRKGKEIFYLTTHSTHFIYGYMASQTYGKGPFR